ncbi:MAG: hypothetical protein LBV06_02760 [Propionibacteriaceae bacterium]|jgi:tetratricopeptide (TPR) repeat protein|nr:hypothetical protein [Propionibacteriaceae bacterium]
MLDDVQMPRAMKAELRGLPAEMAEIVGAHLMMAGRLIDEDPELAYRHAEAARRRAARLPITREASAEAAYAAGKYEEALIQYRALRRMTGSVDVIPVMVDCLRAMKRYRDALELAQEGQSVIADASMRVELIIVVAGIRVDMGMLDEALRLLRAEVEHPSVRHPRLAQARLLYAFADLLTQAGDLANAYRGFSMAASLDPDGATAALDRLDEFDGVTLDLNEDEFFDDDQDELTDGEDGQDRDEATDEDRESVVAQNDDEVDDSDEYEGDSPRDESDEDAPAEDDPDRGGFAVDGDQSEDSRGDGQDGGELRQVGSGELGGGNDAGAAIGWAEEPGRGDDDGLAEDEPDEPGDSGSWSDAEDSEETDGKQPGNTADDADHLVGQIEDVEPTETDQDDIS